MAMTNQTFMGEKVVNAGEPVVPPNQELAEGSTQSKPGALPGQYVVVAAEKDEELKLGEPVYSPSGQEWSSYVEKYLEQQGWEKEGRDRFGRSTWGDPLAAGPKKPHKEKYELPGKEKGTVEVMERLVTPPCRWSHNAEEAYRIAKSRDKTGVESTYQRLERIGADNDTLRTKFDLVSSSLQELVRRPIPEKVDGLVRDTQHTKKTLYELITLLRS